LRAQQALERFGAIKEGVLRKHMVVQEGYHRDSVYFSVTVEEWPEVKKRLQGLCNR
jgi:RimJ/RimL family protein N-acetyltransferase